MRLLLRLLRLLAGLWVLAASIPAVLALFGFAAPFLDLFNHLQLLLFWATIAGVALAAALTLPRLWIGVALLGFAASSWTYLPEWASSLEPRPSRSEATVLKLMTHNIFGLNYDMQRLADAIVAKSPVAVATGKGMFYRQLEMGMEDAYSYAAEVMACNMMAEDAQEGIDAFIEKRAPVWKGR